MYCLALLEIGLYCLALLECGLYCLALLEIGLYCLALLECGLYCLALLECGLFGALSRDLEVGEVLAAPKKFYNRTKYIRCLFKYEPISYLKTFGPLGPVVF